MPDLRVLLLMALLAGSAQAESACTDAFHRSVESRLGTGDAQGHGPDVGSQEWKSVVEFKLGLRGRAGVPRRDTEAWCRYIDERLTERSLSSAGPAAGQGPSFPCDRVRPGGIEALVCTDSALAALDRKLAQVYAAASRLAASERPPRLRAEQRGWIKGRDDCWKSGDLRGCVQSEYERRIAELQARYRLVSGTAPVRYACGGKPANEVVVTYFQTEPPTAIAERGDSVSLMFRQPSASGARYQGRNESLWEHQGEALVTWGHGAAEMRCTKAR